MTTEDTAFANDMLDGGQGVQGEEGRLGDRLTLSVVCACSDVYQCLAPLPTVSKEKMDQSPSSHAIAPLSTTAIAHCSTMSTLPSVAGQPSQPILLTSY